ncbi:MAG: heavy-metal-associated domain-containing protein [Proteobacteria bacterium]|nr:heavy-metal-associated domain-containing protein [Pseudomonadota bacterium]
MEAVSYRVTGMTCGGCVRAVTNAIRASAPAASVAVDLPAGKVTVDGLDEAGVRRAVEDAGFAFAGRG